LDFTALAQRPNEPSLQRILPGASLPSGSRIAFVVQVARQAHVYLFQKSATGAVNTLFPDARIAVKNPLQPGVRMRIPATTSFKLDDKDIGPESVYIVASLSPVPGLIGQDGGRTGEPPSASKALTDVTSIDPGCRSRSLALEEGAADGCVRPRGLSLDSASPDSEASLATRSEAGDDRIATVFTFQHTR
jgi:hypothetical protein